MFLRIAAIFSILILLFSCKPDVPKEKNQINQVPVKANIENEEEKNVIPPTFTTEEIEQLHSAFPLLEFDTLHLWISDESDSSYMYFGKTFTEKYSKLYKKIFDQPFDTGNYYDRERIIGRFQIDEKKVAFIFRTFGWNCLCQINLWLFDHTKNQFSDTLELAFSEGDGGAFGHTESWLFNANYNNENFHLVSRSLFSDEGIMGPVNEKEFRKDWPKVKIQPIPIKDCFEPKEGCRKFIGEKIELYKLKGDKLEIDKSITPDYNKFKFHQKIQF